MTTDTAGQPLDAVLAGLGEVIARLDRRRHILSARLDLALGDRCWVAQILADPLYQPLVGKGDTTADALVDLHAQTTGIDWRRVRR
jgi:hypothetical protein